ncbi:MAG: glutamate racemase [Proteobacteria bacterium]|nr:glutamate racemase [Pseudomonadota bacterium]
MNNPIGIFDSGVGGLTVLKEIKKKLPAEKLIYLGDTARVPYGNKSKDTIVRYSIENTKFLMQFDIKLLVVACNTSTATSLRILKETFDIPIIGVIEPGAKKAVEITRNYRVGIIGTEATIRSSAYKEEIKSLNKKISVFSKPCPLFVPLVEEGLLKGPIVDDVIAHYLKFFKNKDIDTLVLGCTHYPLLKSSIGKFFGNEVKIVDSATETSNMVLQLLKEKGIISRRKKALEPDYYVTDAAERFLKVGRTILGKDLEKVAVVHVGK